MPTKITLEQIAREGYQLKPAPIDDWRTYDELNPVPGYFQFDWLSAHHPDLYHKFALSTNGLMDELRQIFDLAGLKVLDIGAGTGRSAIEAARKARIVAAVDLYESVISYGKKMVSQAGLSNVEYCRGDMNQLPFTDNSFDVAYCAWALLNYREAYRVIRPEGYLIELGAAPGSLCGELTGHLADIYPEIITEIAPQEMYDLACPDSDQVILDDTRNGCPVTPPIVVHDFTCLPNYGDYKEAAAIFGRLYGPAARQYILDRRLSRIAWRLRIVISRVKK